MAGGRLTWSHPGMAGSPPDGSPSKRCATLVWRLRMDVGQTSPVLDRNRHSILLLYAARAVRGFGDGFAVIILPAYLSEIGFDAFQIGIVATAALLGTAAATLLIGHLGARHDIRNLLLLGAAFMIASGHPVPERAAHRAGRDDRVLRHDKSLDRRSRHAGAAGACDDRALGRRPRAHRRLRTLQPDRRARDGGGRARRGSARSARHDRHRPGSRR